MYCYKCGLLNSDDHVFCSRCGTRLTVAAQNEFKVQAEIPRTKEDMAQKVRTTLKKRLASPLLLIGLIILVLNFFVQLGSPAVRIGNSDANDDSAYISRLSARSVSDNNSFDLFESYYADDQSKLSVLLDVTLPFVISGLLVYIFAKTNKNEMKTGGLIMVRIVSFVDIIRSYIICGLIAVTYYFIVSETMYDTQGTRMPIEAEIIIKFLLLNLIAGACLVTVLLAHKVYRAVVTVLRAFRTGRIENQLTVFTGVLIFLSIPLNIVIVGMQRIAAVSLSSMLIIAARVLLGIYVIKLCSAVNRLYKEQSKCDALFDETWSIDPQR